jgi:cell wall-associated NlpC family hydrolase
MMVTGNDVIREARSWTGTRYLHQGRSRAGVDCIGLIIVVCQRLNLVPLDLPQPRNYGPMPACGLLEESVREHCIELPGPMCGAIALIRWKPKQWASHCGLLTPDHIIHAYARVQKVVEHGFRARWPKLTQAYFALPGVQYS